MMNTRKWKGCRIPWQENRRLLTLCPAATARAAADPEPSAPPIRLSGSAETPAPAPVVPEIHNMPPPTTATKWPLQPSESHLWDMTSSSCYVLTYRFSFSFCLPFLWSLNSSEERKGHKINQKHQSKLCSDLDISEERWDIIERARHRSKSQWEMWEPWQVTTLESSTTGPKNTCYINWIALLYIYVNLPF